MIRPVYKSIFGLLLAVFSSSSFATDSAAHAMSMCQAATIAPIVCVDIGQVSATKGRVSQMDQAGNYYAFANYPWVDPPPVTCTAGSTYQTFQIMGEAPPQGACGGCNCTLQTYSNCSSVGGGGVTCIATYSNDGTENTATTLPQAAPSTVASTPATTDQTTQTVDLSSTQGAPTAVTETDGSVTTTSASTDTETSPPYVEVRIRRNGDIVVTDSQGSSTTVQQDTTTNTQPDGSSTSTTVSTTINTQGGSIVTTNQGGTPITNSETFPSTSSTGSTTTVSTIGADGTSTTSTSTTGTDATNEGSNEFPNPSELSGAETGAIDGLIDQIGGLNVNDPLATTPTHTWTIGGGGSCTPTTYTFALRGISQGLDLCSSIDLVRTALYWFFAMLTAIFVFQTWATANRGA